MNTSGLLKLLFVITMFPGISSAQQSRNCGTMQNFNEILQLDPEMRSRMGEIERHTASFVRTNSQSQSQAIITIPVVVHVVYNTSSQNISDAQIQSQISVLTADFRRLNSDKSNTPSYFASKSADAQIEFCLAVRDPSGNVTTGITRTSTSSSSFSTNNYVKHDSYGGKSAWPASDYLNLWVCNISGNTLGYAQFPGGSAATDGVVIDYAYFGSGGSANYPYNKGRTATHEVGHWLNLRHIWGDASCGNDYVSDTPTQASDNGGCPGFPSASCGNYSDMFMNYMDYTYDACMNAFSVGQASRMNALFGNGGFRASLKNSDGCLAVGGPPPTGYCVSQGNDASYEWIAGVSIGSINNTSGTNGGYNDFTMHGTDLDQGSSYNFTLTPGFASSAYQEYWKIYIDYNQDDDFTDAGELVYDAGSLSDAAVTGSFTVSTSASPGTTRMRVSMKYNGAQTACESFGYGEIEDYAVAIKAPCPVPAGLSASSVTETTATLNWASTGAAGYDVQVKPTASSSWTTFTSTSVSMNVTGMSSGTAYEFRVRSACSQNNNSAYSGNSTYTTLSPTTSGFCGSNGSDATYEWIASVDIGPLTNASASNGGYGDFTSMEADMRIGETYSISLTPGYASSTYTEYWMIWIDYNGDGDFDDAGENVFDQGGLSSTTVTGSIAVPQGLTASKVRMRVSMKYNGQQTVCETFGYGEVEDYTVNLTSTPPLTFCTSKGADASYEWIAGVSVGPLTNTSGTDGGYADYTSKVVSLDISNNYNVTLTPGFNGTVYNEYWKIWIDLNRDGDFQDAGELVFDGGSVTSAALSGIINLPNNASLGMTRMRVSMKYNAASTSCESFSYGEVEDYTVYIVDGAKTTAIDEEEASIVEVNIYPNPAKSDQNLNVKISGNEEDHKIFIFDAFGKEVYSDVISGYGIYVHSISLNRFASGVYFVKVAANTNSQTRRLVVLH